MTVAARERRGMTLIEAMIAMVVLAVGMVGALVALNSSGRELHDGQIRLLKMSLLTSTYSRYVLMNKVNLAALAVPPPTQPPNKVNVGAAPWAVDNSPLVAGDLSTGAFFKVTADGRITQLTTVPLGTLCNGTSQPVGSYCRETMVVTGMPTAQGSDGGYSAINGPGGAAYTVWVRLSRKGDTPAQALVYSELVIQ